MAKSAPAMGALKVAAMPAAEPHATNVRSRLGETCSTWPTAEPMDEPMCTIGPSRPADPPEPMVSAAASALVTMTRNRMAPPRLATASITSGMPEPFTSGARKATMPPTARPPMHGNKSRFHQGIASSKAMEYSSEPKNPWWVS